MTTGREWILRTRTVSDTPLARVHEHRLRSPGERARKEIRWSKLDRTRYPAAALALAARAQLELAAGEYEAFIGFSQVSSALALVGAPFDLVAESARVATDEIRHAEYALRMAALLSGCDVSQLQIPVAKPRLQKLGARRWSLDSVDGLMVAVPAISETISAALIAARRDQAEDPLVRDVLSSILADEIHHARFGWYYLMWRSPQWTRAQRQRVADRAGGLVASTEHTFWRGREAPTGSKRAARALGVLDSVAQRAVIRSVMEEEIVPALDALGLGASHAWRARRRGQ